ncbi:hypothetical protein BLNAU_11549 [Blattamonas nauphoetae]|uniref:Cytochrome b5 heme-binding domain-containing protein n=1 Tax=Blattamonas nauphoetae TaxID=2049346 RepID=A0ABQ9XPU5_9EUKA|nr:hypothetical protein BLNAU_11549 [Blattamonas nauphoetae]
MESLQAVPQVTSTPFDEILSEIDSQIAKPSRQSVGASTHLTEPSNNDLHLLVPPSLEPFFRQSYFLSFDNLKSFQTLVETTLSLSETSATKAHEPPHRNPLNQSAMKMSLTASVALKSMSYRRDDTARLATTLDTVKAHVNCSTQVFDNLNQTAQTALSRLDALRRKQSSKPTHKRSRAAQKLQTPLALSQVLPLGRDLPRNSRIPSTPMGPVSPHSRGETHTVTGGKIRSQRKDTTHTAMKEAMKILTQTRSVSSGHYRHTNPPCHTAVLRTEQMESAFFNRTLPPLSINDLEIQSLIDIKTISTILTNTSRPCRICRSPRHRRARSLPPLRLSPPASQISQDAFETSSSSLSWHVVSILVEQYLSDILTSIHKITRTSRLHPETRKTLPSSFSLKMHPRRPLSIRKHDLTTQALFQPVQATVSNQRALTEYANRFEMTQNHWRPHLPREILTATGIISFPTRLATDNTTTLTSLPPILSNFLHAIHSLPVNPEARLDPVHQHSLDEVEITILSVLSLFLTNGFFTNTRLPLPTATSYASLQRALQLTLHILHCFRKAQSHPSPRRRKRRQYSSDPFHLFLSSMTDDGVKLPLTTHISLGDFDQVLTKAQRQLRIILRKYPHALVRAGQPAVGASYSVESLPPSSLASPAFLEQVLHVISLESQIVPNSILTFPSTGSPLHQRPGSTLPRAKAVTAFTLLLHPLFWRLHPSLITQSGGMHTLRNLVDRSFSSFSLFLQPQTDSDNKQFTGGSTSSPRQIQADLFKQSNTTHQTTKELLFQIPRSTEKEILPTDRPLSSEPTDADHSTLFHPQSTKPTPIRSIDHHIATPAAYSSLSPLAILTLARIRASLAARTISRAYLRLRRRRQGEENEEIAEFVEKADQFVKSVLLNARPSPAIEIKLAVSKGTTDRILDKTQWMARIIFIQACIRRHLVQRRIHHQKQAAGVIQRALQRNVAQRKLRKVKSRQMFQNRQEQKHKHGLFFSLHSQFLVMYERKTLDHLSFDRMNQITHAIYKLLASFSNIPLDRHHPRQTEHVHFPIANPSAHHANRLMYAVASFSHKASLEQEKSWAQLHDSLLSQFLPLFVQHLNASARQPQQTPLFTAETELRHFSNTQDGSPTGRPNTNTDDWEAWMETNNLLDDSSPDITLLRPSRPKTQLTAFQDALLQCPRLDQPYLHSQSASFDGMSSFDPYNALLPTDSGIFGMSAYLNHSSFGKGKAVGGDSTDHIRSNHSHATGPVKFSMDIDPTASSPLFIIADDENDDFSSSLHSTSPHSHNSHPSEHDSPSSHSQTDSDADRSSCSSESFYDDLSQDDSDLTLFLDESNFVKSQPRNALPEDFDTSQLPVISADELAKHNTAEDLWVAIGGVVYDCTNFKHRVGMAPIIRAAGTDITDTFNRIHSNFVKPATLPGVKVMGFFREKPTKPVDVEPLPEMNEDEDKLFSLKFVSKEQTSKQETNRI